MVVVKTARELSKMKDACRISAEALRVAGEAVKPGVTTYEIDNIVRSYIEKQGAVPSFLGYGGFPASACISVNNVVIHGIPSKELVLKEGDIVSVDVALSTGDFTATTPLHSPAAKSVQTHRLCLTPQKRVCMRELNRLLPSTVSVT